MLGGLNHVVFSGTVLSIPSRAEDSGVGPVTRFDLRQVTQQSGMARELKVPIVAYGRRATKLMERAVAGTRVVVQGQVILVDGGLAVFAHWVEFVDGSPRVEV